ncbi:hypothetical protein MHT86_06275 [Corynebacterium mastitidis]|uniref:hypothetical protein n=1 Tax=Corynebacterium mastitidis TaxID=161890 RepID=UPI0012FF4B17|nr:hypothetical protein [Corynebacterium mastitidis]MCH6197101.1 hypothetical protein [Corynebacterium mastitidis]
MSSGKNRVSEILRAGGHAARSAGEVVGEFGARLRVSEDRGRHALHEETVADHLRAATRDFSEHRSVDSLREGAGRVAGATTEALGSLADRVGRAAAETRRSEAAARAAQALRRVGEQVETAAREAAGSLVNPEASRERPGEPGEIIDGEVLSETVHEEDTRNG